MMHNLTELNDREYLTKNLKKILNKKDGSLKGKPLTKIKLPMITDKPYEE